MVLLIVEGVGMDGQSPLWRPPDGHRRGPKPGLRQETIVAAAIAVADADGLEALAMQRVAARLGTATMALYRHVPSKGALVALMVDAAIGPPPELAAEADWRAGLTSWARANRDVLLAHPWLPPLVTAPRVLGPNELAWAERALGVLAAAGLPPRRLVDVLLVINSYVRGASADFTGGPRMPGQQELRRSGRADAYPVLTGLLADVSEPETAELAGSRFELGLGLVLDGVERLLAAQPAHTAGQGLASARGRRPKARAPRAPVR